jgi:hypothetical protein
MLIYFGDFETSGAGSGRDWGCLLVGVFVFRKAVSSNEFGGEKMLVGLASRPIAQGRKGARSRPW